MANFQLPIPKFNLTFGHRLLVTDY